PAIYTPSLHDALPIFQLANGATGIPARRAKLNRNQQVLLNALTEAGGRADTETLRALDVASTTLNTLVKRALVEIIEEPAEFHVDRKSTRLNSSHLVI